MSDLYLARIADALEIIAKPSETNVAAERDAYKIGQHRVAAQMGYFATYLEHNYESDLNQFAKSQRFRQLISEMRVFASRYGASVAESKLGTSAIEVTEGPEFTQEWMKRYGKETQAAPGLGKTVRGSSEISGGRQEGRSDSGSSGSP